MTREDIAKDFNYEGTVFRTIQTDEKLNFEVGQIVDNLGMSWCTEYGVFNVETNREYEYFFRCDGKVKGHEVDYYNDEEIEVLDAEGCEAECEVLVLNSQKFKVVNISSDYDFEEQGYYEVELEAIE